MVNLGMASRTWAGFSEEELKLLRSDLSPEGNRKTSQSEDNKVEVISKQIKCFPKEGKRGKSQFSKKHKLSNSLDIQPLEEDSLTKLSIISSKSSSLERSNSTGSAVIKVDSKSLTYEIVPLEEVNLSKKEPQNDILTLAPTMIENNNVQTNPENGVSSTPSKASKVSPISDLKTFEQRQKRLEAENAKRRELLLKAIDDRKKRTEEEGKKIIKVQAELGKLDSMLSNDVGILRKEIEAASLDFYEAQKRYDKAEKEFVESKLLLFQKMERKERLTEHLCTIIEQNEARKAHRLGELMHDLDLGELYEECKANGMSMVLPQLCALNNVTYNTTCNTLKPTHTPSEIISIMPQDKNSESSKKLTQEQLPPPDEV